MNKYLPIFVIVFLLTACSSPLPENKLHYAGQWQSKEMSLLILDDGSVAYERLKGGATTSINGPLKEFVGDDFVVGILFLTTTFDVSEPPHDENGIWRMTVDGVRLTKVNQ